MKFKKEFKSDHPETIGETDKEFDNHNYTEWLEKKLQSYLDLEAKPKMSAKVWFEKSGYKNGFNFTEPPEFIYRMLDEYASESQEQSGNVFSRADARQMIIDYVSKFTTGAYNDAFKKIIIGQATTWFDEKYPESK